MLTGSKIRWGGVLVVLAVLAGLVGHKLVTALEAPVLSEPDEQLVIQLPTGSHFQGLVSQLQRLSVIERPLLWRFYGRLLKPQVRAGEYWVQPGQSLPELVDQMAQGRVRFHPFTIVEGWTVADLRRRLADEPKLAQLTDGWSNDEVMASVGCEGCFAEGQFLPETYLYARGESDLSILERAHQAKQDAVSALWAKRMDGLPVETPDELLILASLIEKETALDRERATIAGVFVRRLRLGMRLQTDPTVIYGLDETYNGDLTRAHLRTDHPWNTYTRHGLPVTPIALPSRASLHAASQPEIGDALYFVARGDGSHVFSATLEAHNRAVNRYIRGLEQ